MPIDSVKEDILKIGGSKSEQARNYLADTAEDCKYWTADSEQLIKQFNSIMLQWTKAGTAPALKKASSAVTPAFFGRQMQYLMPMEFSCAIFLDLRITSNIVNPFHCYI